MPASTVTGARRRTTNAGGYSAANVSPYERVPGACDADVACCATAITVAAAATAASAISPPAGSRVRPTAAFRVA